MEIEQFWKDIKPFCKCEKGAYNNINYGYRSKHRSPCKTKCKKGKHIDKSENTDLILASCGVWT